ncbi:thioredoxin [Blastomyces dermatitidis ATCC 18188]|uniref:Thioredoxin n=1 Tax=Ajellomyces dermatitidis (strain ATCC 18188 / CBS 674.68) TaxID=653446 RepID=F2TGE1_AJEDA|nr:thioredoxin [Blastomyces dermatitidis ATCC 18188]
MLPKTSSRALFLHTIQHHQPRQPLFTTSTSTSTSISTSISTSTLTTTTTTTTTTPPPPSAPLRLYNSLRPLSFFLRTTSTSTASASASSLSTNRSFTSSARASFRPTAGTMVVHNLKDRASFDSAVATTTPASTASTGQPPKPLIVVDCYATWCGPCKAIAPKLVEFSDTYPNVGFYKVDVDECPDIAQELGVRAMPTFIFFKDGQKVDEVLGAMPAAILAAINKHVSS